MEKVMQSFTDEQKGIKEYYLCDVLQYGKRFPMGTWIYFDVVDYNAAAIVTKAMIEDVLKWSEEDVVRKLNSKTFTDNKLGGMLDSVFNRSTYAAINNAYPEKYKPWQFANVPNSYWTKETAAEATKWFIEEKLKWSEEELLKKLSTKTFYDNGLGEILNATFTKSLYAAINNAYPEKYKPWQFANVPNSYWTKETAAEATRWLIEEKLKWSEEELLKKLSTKTFCDNGLRGMLANVFDGSPYAAIDNAYPEKYKPWQFAKVPNSYWTKETAAEATRWLIEEKLKWSEEELLKKLSTKTFTDNKLVGMFASVFNRSPYAAINNAYPGKYKPWQFANVPKSYWTKETAAEATRWLIEEKLKWSEEELLKKLSTKTFYDNGLGEMLNAIFTKSPYAAINNAYPEKYKPW